MHRTVCNWCCLTVVMSFHHCFFFCSGLSWCTCKCLPLKLLCLCLLGNTRSGLKDMIVSAREAPNTKRQAPKQTQISLVLWSSSVNRFVRIYRMPVTRFPRTSAIGQDPENWGSTIACCWTQLFLEMQRAGSEDEPGQTAKRRANFTTTFWQLHRRT